MKKTVLIIAFVLMAATLRIVHTQDQPGLLRFPAALDSHDSLFRVPVGGVAAYIHAVAYTHLTTSITASSTSITVDDASNFPASGALVIGLEVIYYTTKTGNTFSGLTRGANSTVAASHDAEIEDVRMSMLPVYHERLVDAIIAIETKLGTGTTIDPTKIGAGNVNSTKFGYLANVTSDIQAQLNTISTPSLYNTLTFQNSWANVASGTFGVANWSKQGNLVCLQGLISGGADNTVPFTMPVGTRPNASVILTTKSDGQTARITIATNGQVTVNEFGGSWLSISGVCYVVP